MGHETHGGPEVVNLIHALIPLARVHHPLVKDWPVCHCFEDAADICLVVFGLVLAGYGNDVGFLKTIRSR
jgi:hypothetical protein